jgi:hypothetical protein
MEAFMTPSRPWAKALRGERWVVTIPLTPRARRASRMAWERAAPSSGSVPLPSSSMRTRLLSVAPSSISLRRFRCPAKVERLS